MVLGSRRSPGSLSAQPSFSACEPTQEIIIPKEVLLKTNTSALQGFWLTDSFALILGFLCALGLAITINAVFWGRYDLTHAIEDGIKATQSLLIGGCVILWFAQCGHYHLRMPFWMETQKVIEAIGFALLIDIFFRAVVKEDFSRLWLISGWCFVAFGIIGLRGVWRHHKNKKGEWRISTLLIGQGPTAKETARAIAAEPSLGFHIVAHIDHLPVAFPHNGLLWKDLCAKHKASHVILALDGTGLEKAGPAFAQLTREGVAFSISPPLQKTPVMNMVPHYFLNHDVMLLAHNHGLNQKLPSFLKRGFDTIMASLALLTLSPFFLAIIPIIHLDGGPAFFRQKRLGMNGKVFYCLKFRSMVMNSDQVLENYLAQNPPLHAEWNSHKKLRDGDPRVTLVGRFLRHWSLDELPQLLNVLSGDMSLVGPRPILLVELNDYGNDIAHYNRVRPGLTGLWQVSGRSDLSYAERVRMDSWYVRNWSLWNDIVIICKTLPAVLHRKGAY